MTQLQWDKVGERIYETGVSKGVLYLPDNTGDYDEGYAWNGLTAITESPSGAEANKQYADNIVYVNLRSAEEFGGTIEAFTYPEQWEQCDGSASPQPGISLGQQGRRTFGLSYQTLLGNDLEGTDYGYKIHLIWGATASPSERAYATVNDSPEAATLSWEISTTPVEVGTIGGVTYKPSSSMTIDSTKVDSTALAALEELLYGTVGTDPSLPSPAEVIDLFDGTITTTAAVTAPTYNSTTDLITIPTVTGVVYKVDGEIVTGTYGPITENTVVTAEPASGYRFPVPSDNDWLFTFA
jgi:hypothetical protein